MAHLLIPTTLLPLELFDWMPPGFSIIAELIVLVGGLYGFVLLVREFARCHGGSTAPAPAGSGNKASPALLDDEVTISEKAGTGRPGAIETAVIATVCHLFLTRPHRIVSIRQSGGPGGPWSGAPDYTFWSREGRRDIFTSHLPR